jgi:hypothetical protein
MNLVEPDGGGGLDIHDQDQALDRAAIGVGRRRHQDIVHQGEVPGPQGLE